MSKNDNSDNLNNVGNSNIDVDGILKAIKTILKGTEQNEYIEFCKKYIGQDFEIYSISKLQQIYESGKGLLNQYFVTEDNSCDNEILIQLQYILNDIMYNIIIKQNKETKIETDNLNDKLKENIEESKIIKEDTEQKNEEIKHMKNDIKSIMTTIISIILAISIIPTAIAGIEKISPDYILPFLSSVVLFGIIMITFVYSIYQDKLKKSTCIVLAVSIIICICFWVVSFTTTISKDTNNENLPTNEINNQTAQIITE